MLAASRRGHIVCVGYLVYAAGGTARAASGATVATSVERRSVLLLDATVPLIVGAVIVGAGVVHGGTSTRPLAVVVGLAAAAVLAARQRAPGWTLVISAVLVLALHLFDAPAAEVALLAPAVALYSLALNRGRVEQVFAAVGAAAVVVIIDVLHKGNPGILATLGHVTLVAIPLLAAEMLRTRRSYVSLMHERFALAHQTREQDAQRRVEQERLRIARDLHDIVAHSLTAINVQAATAAQLLDRNPENARVALETIEDTSRDAIGELRAILGVLRDRDNPDAPHAPAPGVNDLGGLVKSAADAGLDVSFETTGMPPPRLSDAVSLAAYRIVQESLTNAQRHAPGAAVRVDLAYDAAELRVAVSNDAGRAVDSNGATPGVGITGMTERAQAVGGALRAQARADGFAVQASLPYALAAE